MSVAEQPMNVPAVTPVEAPAALTPTGMAAPAPSWPQRIRRWLGHTGPDYTVGTLTYTRLGLCLTFLWLLWGDLVWSLMEIVFPASMPLQLDRLGVPREWIGYMWGTAGAVINMSFVPVISFRSDRTRTRWGRRIPYIVATMPFLCLFLAMLGFSDSLGPAIRNSNWPARLHLSPTATIILVMGVLILLYDVFNVFVNSVFWYLFRDVIPSAFLGRFMAAFRMVGTVANMLWGLFVYGKIETHTREIYLGAAGLYLFGFGLMCLMVREGEYPPPEDVVKGEPWLRKTWHAIVTYARQCFSHPVYIMLYLSTAMFALANACGMYKQFFYLRHLAFTTEDLGRVTAVLSPVILAIQFPLGWLVDRIHPLRGMLIATTAVIPLHFAGFFMDAYSVWGYTISAFTFYVTLSAVQMPLTQLQYGSEIPLLMRLFPAKQYGQFSSANAMLRHCILIFGTIAGATLIGYTNRRYGEFGNAYAYLWQGTFHSIGAVCLWIVFYYWRRSGRENFNPDPDAETAN